MQTEQRRQDDGLNGPLVEHDVVDDLDAKDWDREGNKLDEVTKVHLVSEVLLSEQLEAS